MAEKERVVLKVFAISHLSFAVEISEKKNWGNCNRDHTSQNHFCSMYFFAVSENATERSRDDVAGRHLQSGKKCVILTPTVWVSYLMTAWRTLN